MRHAKSVILIVALGIGCAGSAWAQMGMRPPEIPGIFKPAVGSGAQYGVTAKEGKMEMAIAIVGKESVDGADGFWTEIRLLSGKGEGTIMKQLMVINGDQPSIKRMIMQSPGHPPMEMPMAMMAMMKNIPKAQLNAKNHGMGEVVGTESVTVPAGTFECQHYQSKSDHGTTDVWFTTKISPYGMVKMTSQDQTMVLDKVLANETSQIKGEPQKMNFPGMQH